MGARYTIPEEPQPGPLSRVAVRPFWPLFGTMIGPGPLGWAWFLLNSFATQSPSRWREVAVASVGLVLWLVALALQGQVFAIAPDYGHYAALGVVTLNISVGYVMWSEQNRSFHLWENLGRPVANGLFGVAAIFLLLRPMSMTGLRQVGLMPPLPQVEAPVHGTDDTDNVEISGEAGP